MTVDGKEYRYKCTVEGVTRFTFEGKPYFFVSDHAAAAAALETLH